MKASAK